MSSKAAAVGIYCLDVGQGDCTFIVGPGESPTVVLFDCADSFVGQRFMKDHHYRRIEAVVASHQDEDHIKGLVPLMKWLLDNGGSIGSIWLDHDRLKQTAGGKELIKYALKLHRDGVASLPSPTREDEPKSIVGSGNWDVQLICPRHVTRVEAQQQNLPNLASIALRVSKGCRRRV